MQRHLTHTQEEEHHQTESDFEVHPTKFNKEFSKAYLELVEDMAKRAAAGEEESQLLVTEEEIAQLNRMKKLNSQAILQ